MNHAFPCGTPALDFVGTLRARRNAAPLEKLDSDAMLDAWFIEAGLVDEAPGAAGSDRDSAIELREAIYDVVTARRLGENLPAHAVDIVNVHAAEVPIGVRLDGLDPTAVRVRRGGTIRQGLAALARQTVEIVGGEEAALLRECARPECTQVYLDRSRGHRREWCAMKTCGNRVKASKFRERHRPDA
ncbi:ABATE domain-containing protein [Microbacterium sp. Au-Mic1]|uniref:CGNR zinc finger domain-containing protein n=1 Tax=Microbacterium sp. Au-Mic1 TaxID=2906457 RepID=UPI001E5070A4|nr:ABATE domain-containing protein [Microbacterium sp. Au-Mic1]MCE4027187.1 ABATE domain-containing protein [Microbacterium sp. Au-Mic1]